MVENYNQVRKVEHYFRYRQFTARKRNPIEIIYKIITQITNSTAYKMVEFRIFIEPEFIHDFFQFQKRISCFYLIYLSVSVIQRKDFFIEFYQVPAADPNKRRSEEHTSE